MFGGFDGRQSALFKKLGKAGLHPFAPAFSSIGISKTSQLQAMTIKEIQDTGKRINMPPAAVDRLLEVLGRGKKNVNPSKKAEKIVQKKREKVQTSTTSDAKSQNAESNEKKENEQPVGSNEKSAREASSYYHFASTSKENARKFDAQRVDDPAVAIWRTSNGASSWNPGNTNETRDFSKQACEMLKILMSNFEFCDGSIRISKVKKTEGDFSIVVARGKVKNIYDLSFEADFIGKVEGEEVKGKLNISDIMADDDDWEIQCTTKSKIAKALLLSDAVSRMKNSIMLQLVVEIRTAAGLV